jgi:hypothetical protein
MFRFDFNINTCTPTHAQETTVQMETFNGNYVDELEYGGKLKKMQLQPQLLCRMREE